ncbi:cancer/testis antigen 55-like [Sapajus apella]|uniref:Cancer/testis antigen 55-like n=1 Tax=Sapajus apella TaxID=9515 RepID=A0A6J3HG19_SAPAP|nr:cancer/testis antigen 55-like [Sapajus apella]
MAAPSSVRVWGGVPSPQRAPESQPPNSPVHLKREGVDREDLGGLYRLCFPPTSCSTCLFIFPVGEKLPNSRMNLGLYPKRECEPQLKTVQGVVTSFCGDYGVIDESIYFSCDVVTGNEPLKVGQRVNAVVEEDKTLYGLRAIKVDIVPYDAGPSDAGTKLLVGCVTSISEDTVYISDDINFSLDIISEDFVPYEGDWLDVEYSSEPGISNIKAISAKPTRWACAEEVCITSVRGRNGVIDNNIFFTLDSVKLPHGYQPQLFDTVSVVMVESTHFCYVWRAVSIIPAQKSPGSQDDGGLGWPETKCHSQSI